MLLTLAPEDKVQYVAVLGLEAVAEAAVAVAAGRCERGAVSKGALSNIRRESAGRAYAGQRLALKAAALGGGRAAAAAAPAPVAVHDRAAAGGEEYHVHARWEGARPHPAPLHEAARKRLEGPACVCCVCLMCVCVCVGGAVCGMCALVFAAAHCQITPMDTAECGS